ncbi:rhodanese-like domain-containing protein [Vibrio breoganii]
MSTHQIVKEKQTALQLYITSSEAYQKWKKNPDKVIILDVRTPEEHLFVGYPDMAWRIPVIEQSYKWNAESQKYPMVLLPDFVARVSKIAKPDDTIMAMCRSGGRSAIAVNLLAQAGFTNVYNIIDGMEGDDNENSEKVSLNTSPANGWKNTGCPWTKRATPEKQLISSSVE